MVKFKEFDLYQQCGQVNHLFYTDYQYTYRIDAESWNTLKFRTDIANFCSSVDVISITKDEWNSSGRVIVWYREKWTTPS